MEMKSFEIFPKDPKKTYGLMELVEGKSSIVDKEPEDTVFTWPHLFSIEFLGLLITVAVLLFLAMYVEAPLEQVASTATTPNPMKAPWYFLGLQELVSHSAFWGGVVVPTLIVMALVALPYIDRKRSGIGVWFSGERKVAVTIFTICLVTMIVLTLIGSVFRGPNWAWQVPWKVHASAENL